MQGDVEYEIRDMCGSEPFLLRTYCVSSGVVVILEFETKPAGIKSTDRRFPDVVHWDEIYELAAMRRPNHAR